MSTFLSGLVDKYPIVSIEDGMDQNDWIGWQVKADLTIGQQSPIGGG